MKEERRSMRSNIAKGVTLMAIAVLAANTNAQAAVVKPAYCAHISSPPEELEGAVAYTYRKVGSRELRVHVFMPEGGAKLHPAVMLFFGGGFRTGDPRSFARHAKAFAEQGYVAAVPDYRVLCRDGVNPSAGVADAEEAYRWLRNEAPRLQVDRKRIVVAGGSAGGFLAVSTAADASRRHKPAAVVLYNPVTNLEVGPWAESMSPSEVNKSKVTERRLAHFPPTIVFHGTADRTVPFQTATDFCNLVEKVKQVCQMNAYDGLDHSFYMLPTTPKGYSVPLMQDTLQKTFSFLSKVLSARS